MWRRFGGLPQSGDTGLLLAGPRASPNNMTSILRSNMMKTLGIRQAKAHRSQLVRDAAEGECSLVTDNGRLVAMIGPPPEDPAEAEDPSPVPTEEANAPSDAAEFRKALFGVPSPIELNF
jgi:antitoxin (DNA-binding transcriptional repressor) of toxin-antitoxin stability system